MRPWRLLIEVGNPEGPAPKMDFSRNQPGHVLAPADDTRVEPQVNRAPAWENLVEARRKMLAEPDDARRGLMAQWIGGGLAIMALLVGEEATTLQEQLRSEVPPEATGGRYANMGEFVQVDRPRPPRPPGAQRPVNLDELSDEELVGLRITQPPPVEEDEPNGL